jgi:hypothetical protein
LATRGVAMKAAPRMVFRLAEVPSTSAIQQGVPATV